MYFFLYQQYMCFLFQIKWKELWVLSKRRYFLKWIGRNVVFTIFIWGRPCLPLQKHTTGVLPEKKGLKSAWHLSLRYHLPKKNLDATNSSRVVRGYCFRSANIDLDKNNEISFVYRAVLDARHVADRSAVTHLVSISK